MNHPSNASRSPFCSVTVFSRRGVERPSICNVERTTNSALVIRHETKVLHANVGQPEFVQLLSQIHNMSSKCPITVLLLSNLCPCLTYVQVLSHKSKYCPLQIQSLSSWPPTNPTFVLSLFKLFTRILLKIAGQSLDKFWQCY